MSGPPDSIATQGAGSPKTTAFWLSLAGLVLQGVSVLMLASMYSFASGFGGMMGYYPGMMGGYFGSGWMNLTSWGTVLWVVAVGLGILGVFLMGSRLPERARSGAVIVLIAAVLSLPMMWGTWLGSILMFVGAILGLTSQPGGR